MKHFWKNLHHLRQRFKRLDTKQLNSFGRRNIKETKQNSQNRGKSPMPEREEPIFQ